jgi:hypothetical protein
MMHGPINIKSSNNISKWQMGFNSAFKGLIVNTGLLDLIHFSILDIKIRFTP